MSFLKSLECVIAAHEIFDYEKYLLELLLLSRTLPVFRIASGVHFYYGIVATNANNSKRCDGIIFAWKIAWGGVFRVYGSLFTSCNT